MAVVLERRTAGAMVAALTQTSRASVDPIGWIAETLRGCAGGLGDGPRLAPDTARRLAADVWTELLRFGDDVFPVQAERLGIRFYLHEERGSHRLSALAWDGTQWRTVGSLRVPASD